MNFLDTLSVNNMADFYQFSETGFIIEYSLLILFLIFITVTIGFLSKKVALTSFAGGCAIVLILIITFLYNEYNYVFYLLSALYASFILLVVFINLGSLRKFFAFKNPNAPKAKKGKPEVSKIFNKEELYDVIEKTVKSLSRSKTGAIITFQRNDDLKYLIKNGVSLKCDVSQELLETIFYPGTRLHDGAVIIKDDKIIKASVYYTLTTKPLNGKYGSRHRAAIGISEVSDSVTVVVSEETGRVSIAVDGGIEAVPLDSFKRMFSETMENL